MIAKTDGRHGRGLGEKTEDAAKYRALSKILKRLFQKKYILGKWLYFRRIHRQSYATGLYFDLFPEGFPKKERA